MDRRRAFTLLELLVVIAIMGIMAAILFPALSKVRSQAKRTMCASNLKQVGVGLRSYLSENKDRLPYASFLPSTGPFPLSTKEPIYIADVLEDHVGGEPRVFRCPMDDNGDRRPEPNRGKTYFESERSSYEYRWQFAGRTTAEVAGRIERRIGEAIPDNTIWIMRDFDNFHGKGGTVGARRYLYGDGHVTDYEF